VTNRKTHISQSPELFYGTPILFNVEYLKIPDIAGNLSKVPKFLQPFLYTFQRLFFTFKTRNYLRHNNFDCIYGRDQWLLSILTYLSKIPVIWESHEAKFSFVARILLKRCKEIVVISEGIFQFYTTHGVPAEKILVAHDGIDESFFLPTFSRQEARKVLGIDFEVKPVVMYIGGLDAWKGVDTLFEAGTKFDDEFATYVIGGKEDELESYRAKFPKINFLGPRPYKDLKNHQKAADVLVIPNTAKNKLSSEYTSPLKLFAHMTAEVPIVASDIPSLTNVLSSENAYFFEADNSDSLGKVLVSVICSPLEGRRKAHNAFLLSKHYTWSARAELIVNFIED
jgi:glycosyltransferase involved in cell wall biosynthesis